MSGLFGYDPPEEEDDNICPECGADWAAGESCDDDCDINAAYEAEMADEDKDEDDG